MSKKISVVELAKKRFERARNYYADQRSIAVDDTKFALGDYSNEWQWASDVRNERKSNKRVCLTINRTMQHCNQIINDIRRNRPSVKVSPVDNNADVKTAEILGGLVRNILVSSQSDDAHDLAAEHAVLGGEGFWRIITEYESPNSFNQCIKIKCIQNPQLVFIDPDCKELDKSDAKWGFVYEDIPLDVFKSVYPDIDPQSWGDVGSWASDDTVRIAEYYYCDVEKRTLYMLHDGTITQDEPENKSDIFASKVAEFKKWTWCKLVGGHDEPVDSREWLGEYLPIIAVVGKELNVNGKIVRKGIVRDLVDPARMVNYSYSEAIQTVAMQNKVPYMAAAEAIEGYEAEWNSANVENRTYLPFNAYDDNGQPLPKPSREPSATMPAAQITLLQLSTDEMRAASGQQNANFGIKSEATSGIGIQRLKQQGEVATFHFPDNLSRALRHEARVIIDLIQKYYDTERVIRITGLDGLSESVTINPVLAEGYREERDGNDIKKIFNPLVGRYDVVVDTGPSYQTQRQESFSALVELSSRSPQLMQVAGDLVMRSADFPMADQLAERLAKTLPPELRDDKDNPQNAKIPPLVAQQMQQMGQQMQMMQQDLQQAQQQLQVAQSGVYVKIQAAEADNQLKQQQMQIDADLSVKKMQIEAEIALQKAEIEAQTKLRIAEVNAKVEASIGALQVMHDTEIKKSLHNDDICAISCANLPLNGVVTEE